MMVSPQTGTRVLRGRFDALLDDIGRRVAGGGFVSGQVLRLEDLEKEFGVSRSVTREAIRVLESIGMVSSGRRVGITVLPASQWRALDPRVIGWRLADEGTRADQLRALAQFRYAIEPTAAEYMAKFSTRGERARLLLCGEELAASVNDVAEFTRLDVAFHSLILAGARNDLFTALEPTLATSLIGRTDYHLLQIEPESPGRHLAIARAIFDQDGPRAAQCLRLLLTEVVDRFSPLATTSD